MHIPKIGITIGDINGIGPEVIMKTFSNPNMLKMCTPIIYGHSKVFSYYQNTMNSNTFSYNIIKDVSKAQAGQINLINVWDETFKIEPGQTTIEGGKAAYISLDACLQDINEKLLDAMVTSPINKKAMHMADFPYPGHTEYLAKASGHDALMILANNDLRVALVSTHVPIKEVATDISKEKISLKLKTLYETLVVDFGISKPIIAVLGLNPHAGDDGIMGDEEEKIIRPAIVEAKKSGKFIHGPFAADGFFGSGKYNKFDAILAMYHDQGLVGFKSLSFGEGINYSAGLKFIRTSPDHGTGFDIVGQDKADPTSFRKAIFEAIDISRNRFEYHDSRANKLKVSTKRTERY